MCIRDSFKRLIGNPREEFSAKQLSPEESGKKFFRILWSNLPSNFCIKRLVLTAPIDTYKNLFKSRGSRVKPTTSLDWDIVRKHISEYGMRNSNTMAIAPTATISYICGCSQSIEPNFGVIFVYSTLFESFIIFQPTGNMITPLSYATKQTTGAQCIRRIV